MKTLAAKVASVAALIVAVSPAVSLAQNSVTQPGMVNRSVERLTLLSGPHLLSWPRSALPPSKPVPSFEAGTGYPFRAGTPSSGGVVRAGSGTLTLSPDPMTFSSEAPKSNAGAKPRKESPPNPETLRFDSTLRSPVPVKNEAALPFKRD